jgi:site-specific DNA-methyltransferase (adenine-specific)
MTAHGTLIHGDCIHALKALDSATVDFVLTDPPYIVGYRARDGRSVANDDNAAWVQPAFAQIYRVLKSAAFCVSFYAWNRADLFMSAWREAGFRPVGHIVFRKRYASSTRFLSYQHESAYLLAKGDVIPPARPIPDVLDFPYTGNKHHPTQKPLAALKPLIDAFCSPSGIVLDPFAGSGSTLVAASRLQRRFVGMEIDAQHYRTARSRLQKEAVTASTPSSARAAVTISRPSLSAFEFPEPRPVLASNPIFAPSAC